MKNFYVATIILFSLCQSALACKSIVSTPGEICFRGGVEIIELTKGLKPKMKNQKVLPSDEVKQCIFRLMDMSPEAYRQSFDFCLNGKVGFFKLTSLTKKELEFVMRVEDEYYKDKNYLKWWLNKNLGLYLF
jgi:hypothetical protein